MFLKVFPVCAALACPAVLCAQDSVLVRPYSETECPSCAEWNVPHRPVHLYGNTYYDSQTPISQDGFRFSDSRDYPTAVADFQRGHALLEQISCDVLVTPHPGASALWDRIRTAPEGLIDAEACKRYAAAARRQLHSRLERERK